MRRAFFILVYLVLVTPCGADIICVDDIGSGDYRTIQAAINAATDGDEVVLMSGTYTGAGNQYLDFKGKAITVRSLDPSDKSCMRATIIDADGHGLIVRFVNDEGAQSRFEGFTLVAGDASANVRRGVPGFFEFSEGARPTMRRLHIAGEASMTSLDQPQSSPQTELLAAAPPYGGRLWDGNNPFHQPAATTDYYGSGDVNKDGQLTAEDVLLSQSMVDGTIPHVSRADVDGDSDVDNSDVALINAALSGAVLCAWWN